MSKNKRLTLAMVLVLAVLVFDHTIYDGSVKDIKFVLVNGLRGLVILTASWLALVPSGRRSEGKVSMFSYSVIATAALVLAAGYISPKFVANLSAEDYAVENLTALFLLACAPFLVWSAIKQGGKKNWLVASMAMAMAGLFFVMGMEEISWMQRIFDRDTTGFFAEHNQQSETNLHNLNATVSNQVFALGGFVLLTALPYYHDQTKAWLKKGRLRGLTSFLPDAWLFLPFAVAVGFGFPSAHISVVMLLILSLTGLMLLSRRHYWVLAFVALAVVSTAVNKGIYTDYVNAYQEYREFFIALGCLVYVVGVSRRLMYK